MTSARLRVRGRPLMALAFVLTCWVGLRAASWDQPMLAPTSHGLRVARKIKDTRSARVPGIAPAPQAVATPPMIGSPLIGPPLMGLPGRGTGAVPLHGADRERVARPRARWPVGRRPAAPYRLAAADDGLPDPGGVVPPDEPPVAMTRALLAPHRAEASRWSGDAWLLLRRGGTVSLASGPGFATYGASQAGAVLRYRLVPDSGHRPAAYLRATAALNGSGEREVATGLSARPVAALPVAALAELRVTRQPGGTRLRPAVMAVTEIAPVALPQRLRAEIYGQVGYVGGRAATAFVDGQIRLDRGLDAVGPADLRFGVGGWGGAQKGASRLDLGPTVSASLAAGHGVFVRLSADWRLRVAGNAAPASGPALTLSAGF